MFDFRSGFVHVFLLLDFADTDRQPVGISQFWEFPEKNSGLFLPMFGDGGWEFVKQVPAWGN